MKRITAILVLMFMFLQISIATNNVSPQKNEDQNILKSKNNKLIYDSLIKSYNINYRWLDVYNQQTVSSNNWGIKNKDVLDLTTVVEKNLNNVLTKREDSILKQKEKVLKALTSLQQGNNSIPQEIKRMIAIESSVKNASAVLLLKLSLTPTTFYKPFVYKGKLYLLFINPIIVYEDKLDMKLNKVSQQYKQDVLNKLQEIINTNYKQQWETMDDTDLVSKLKALWKKYWLQNFYNIVDVNTLKINLKAWKENQPPILEFKKINLAYYNNLYYIPEKLKYLIDKKALYFYIPIWNNMISKDNKMILKQLVGKNAFNNINLYNNLCYYMNINNGIINSMFETNIAFCWIWKNFTQTNSDAIKANNYYNVNVLELNKLWYNKKYNMVFVNKRPFWTVIPDILLSLLWIVLAYLIFRKVNIEQKKESITEKEEL